MSESPSTGASHPAPSGGATPDRPPLGKLAPGALRDRVLAHLGAARDDVVLGPAPGVDAALVRLQGGNVLALTTDPLSLVPAIGIEASARLAAHLVASDLWTTGVQPAWAAVTLNLPPQLSDLDLERYAAALGAAWRELGVAVVTGHTGRYAGCDLTIVGACTLVGVGDAARTVGPAHARAGDRVIVTKGCAVETTALAAWIAPGRLAAHAGAAVAARAR
ncbi:MAG TPA: AIR synthase related protein, partial [Candidatus Eisenbacteria bacterium]|nr:AIR synthase related protein [Candidatus Eisenbacteria bacterium]